MKKKLYITPLTTVVNVALTTTMLDRSLTGTNVNLQKGGDMTTGTAGSNSRSTVNEDGLRDWNIDLW